MSDDTVAVDSDGVWPENAEGVEEGVVATWFAREGASVEREGTLCEIQIEKVSVDVPAPVDGTLVEIVVGESEEFERGDALARIERE